MPDQLAHTRFARRVMEAAPLWLRRRISVQSPAFRAGAFGPDPIFNDPSPRRRAEGFELHHRPGCCSLERMRFPIRSRMPWAADYAAGYFCHYALDRQCHPHIKAMETRGEIRHVALEAAYDRELHLRDDRDIPYRIPLSPSALRAAAAMYQRIGPGRYRADLEAYWQIRRLLILGGGTPLAALPGRLQPAWDGLIPHKKPDSATRRGIEMLDDLLEENINESARQLALYFEAIDQNLPLDPWTYADFSGFQTRV